MRIPPYKDLEAPRVPPRGAYSRGVLLSLLTLLLLSIPSAQALGSLGALPSSSAPESAVPAHSDASASAPVSTSVQPAVADATAVVTNVAQKAPEAAAQAPAAVVSKGTTAPSGTANPSNDKPATQLLKPATQTVHVAATPVLQPATRATATTGVLKISAAPTREAGKAVAPVLDTVTHTVDKAPVSALGKTAAPVLEAATSAASKTAEASGHTATAVLPVLDTTAPGLRAAGRALTPNLASGLVAVGHVAAPVLQAAGRATTPFLQTADRTLGVGIPSALRPPAPRSPGQSIGDATAVTVASAAARGASSAFVPQTGGPLGDPFFGPSPCSASAGLMTKELLQEEGCKLLFAGRLPALSFVQQWLRAGLGAELSSALLAAGAPGYGHRAGATSTVGALISPEPAPLPGGSTGGVASGAGVFFSVFITLASLLLMGSLAAMRLLRLASESWRPAPFVLIPERPG
jgi:hypothetical protein